MTVSHSLSGHVPVLNFIAATNLVLFLLSHLSLSGVEFDISVVNFITLTLLLFVVSHHCLSGDKPDFNPKFHRCSLSV